MNTKDREFSKEMVGYISRALKRVGEACGQAQLGHWTIAAECLSDAIRLISPTVTALERRSKK